MKSVEAEALPFDLRPEGLPPCDAIASIALKAPLDEDGVPVLPGAWDNEDE
ncbi:hypothetical protein [Parvibacter caecicola]|uniref:hypothetical protein n=1 Tax=Parvibacter caecicola TaxID=747645 RepID=UPI00145E8694|nr:hypothetical protein [Parvibacter caecicola]